MTVGLKDLILNQGKEWSQAVLVHTHTPLLSTSTVFMAFLKLTVFLIAASS